MIGTKHFHTPRQDAFIRSHGEQVMVWSALNCPCVTAERQFDPLCGSCHGTGRFYPAPPYATWLLLVLEMSERALLETGGWRPGTIQASTLSTDRLSDRDVVRRVDVLETFNDEVLTHGMDEQLLMRAGITLQLIADRERIYRAGLDYSLTPPNTITWLPTGTAPPFMGQYSVRYVAHPEYLVSPDNPRERYEHRRGQSQVVILHLLEKSTDDW